MDREKVIRGLEELEGFLFKEYTNIKAEESKIYYDRFKSLSDAVAMLKEQEAVEPKEIINEHFPVGDYRRTIGWLCGKCGKALMGDGVYCSYCGQAVKWE